MAKIPVKYVVDTNVPKIANLHVDISGIPQDELECVLACVEHIQKIIAGEFALVIDSAGEIFAEYMRQLSLSGQPGMGDAFMQWVHDNQWLFPDEDRVEITKNGDTYEEFPDDECLASFDKSDMKFVATANAHTSRPAIAVALDRGWFRHGSALEAVGISLNFLCPAST